MCNIAISCCPSLKSSTPDVVDYSSLNLQEIIKSQKYISLRNALRRVSKTELHAHLGGAVSMDFLKRHSTAQVYNELSGFIQKLKEGIDYKEGFKAFPMIGKILNTNKLIEDAAFDFCQSQYADQVTFSELRTGLKRLDGNFEDYLKAVLRGLERGMRAFPVKVNLILSLRRDTPSIDANETINLAIKYRDQEITGIDVSGESIRGNGDGIFEALERAKKHDFPITLHIGENPNESPEQQMKELSLLQPSRVGHAVFLCPQARKWIEEKQVVIEACLRSAIAVSMIRQPAEHPALELFKKGHPVVFCTDDSTLFGDLTDELALVACLCNLSVDKIVEMQKKAITHAFK